jgi:hypothetical protein
VSRSSIVLALTVRAPSERFDFRFSAGDLVDASFFRSGTREDRLGVIETRFPAAFGWSLAEAEARWRDFLQ